MIPDPDDTPPHGIPRPVTHQAVCRKPIAECFICTRLFDLIPKGER